MNPPPRARRSGPGRAILLGLALLAGATGQAAEPAGFLPDLAGRPSLGREEAPVTVLEVSSFKCSHCRVFHEKTFPALRRQYIDTGRVRWVVLNASDDPGEQYGRIFSLARCAQRQGVYWEMQDTLFRVAHRAPSFLEDAVAQSPHLNREELDLCLRDRATRRAVDEDFASYARLKLKGTPSFIVWKIRPGGERIEARIAGAHPLEYFQRVIDELLALP